MPVILPDVSVQVQPNKKADLAAKIVGDLALATVHLFTNDFNPSSLSVIGDFTEAVFTGYAAKPLVAWNAVEENAAGGVSSNSTTVLTWIGPNDATGQTVYGYYVVSVGAGTPLVYAARFLAPVGLSVPTDVMGLVPTFQLP